MNKATSGFRSRSWPEFDALGARARAGRRPPGEAAWISPEPALNRSTNLGLERCALHVLSGAGMVSSSPT